MISMISNTNVSVIDFLGYSNLNITRNQKFLMDNEKNKDNYGIFMCKIRFDNQITFAEFVVFMNKHPEISFPTITDIFNFCRIGTDILIGEKIICFQSDTTIVDDVLILEKTNDGLVPKKITCPREININFSIPIVLNPRLRGFFYFIIFIILRLTSQNVI